MKKLILAVFCSMIFSVGTQAADSIDLETCSSYYDGCNTCTVFDGKVAFCTERYCLENETPKCLEQVEEVKTIDNAFDLCEVHDGEYNQSEGLCTFNEYSIDATDLYSLYMDFTGQMMYMGGSRYFNESIGGYNMELMQSDYNNYLFIQNNISTLYKTYTTEVDAKIEYLSSKLNITVSLEDKYEPILGNNIIKRINTIVDSLVKQTDGMTHVEKEKFLINKVKLLEELRNKYSDKNLNGKYSTTLHILDYLFQKIETNISYE